MSQEVLLPIVGFFLSLIIQGIKAVTKIEGSAAMWLTYALCVACSVGVNLAYGKFGLFPTDPQLLGVYVAGSIAAVFTTAQFIYGTFIRKETRVVNQQ